jgi:hypothetical protein
LVLMSSEIDSSLDIFFFFINLLILCGFNVIWENGCSMIFTYFKYLEKNVKINNLINISVLFIV